MHRRLKKSIYTTHNMHLVHQPHRRNPCVHHTIWIFLCTWVWHWGRPWDRQICFPGKWWRCNWFRLCHPCNLCSHRNASGREYNDDFHIWTDHYDMEENLEQNRQSFMKNPRCLKMIRKSLILFWNLFLIRFWPLKNKKKITLFENQWKKKILFQVSQKWDLFLVFE